MKRNNWPVTYKWIAMGTLVAYTAIGGQRVGLAQEGGDGDHRYHPGAQSNLPTTKFAIAPGVLGDALDHFHAATGMQITVGNEGIRDLASPGVVGTFTNEQALQRLLAGTGVSYRFVNATTVSLELTTAKNSVTVTASALSTDQVASGKYTESLLDTPQSVSVVSGQTMSEQNTTMLRDALRNVAGISIAAGEGGSQGDSLTIRGFTARNDIFLDGMRDFGSYYRDTFNQEEVQVLEGPSAITFGRGTTGGLVNNVSKQPGAGEFMSGNATGGSDLTRRLAIDINEPLKKLGEHTAFRVNVMGDDNKVADRDVAEYRRFGFAPSLAFGIGAATAETFSYFHQAEDDTPDYGIPWLFAGPAPVTRHSFYGFKTNNFLRTTDDIFTAKIEHDFDHGITLRNTLRYANEARNAQITEPQTPTCPVPPAAPTANCDTLATPASSILVTRNQLNANSVESMLDDQLDATFRFATGWLRHTAVVGFEGVRETSDPIRNTITGVPTTSLLNPNENQPYSGTAVPATNVHVIGLTLGAYGLDTVPLGRKFDLIGGVRYDDFDANYTQSVAPTAAFTQVIGMESWRGALVFKPSSRGSIYFDAGNSFNPSAESLSLSAATVSTPPESNLTYEVGTKWDLRGGKMSLSGSIFRTDKINAREPDPTNALLNVLGGHQRVNGFQAEVSGYLTDRWEFMSSYALLNSYVVSSNNFPAAVGAELANVPRNTFNFWSTYRTPFHEMQFGLGGNFVNVRTASSTVPFVTVPTGVGSNFVTALKEVPSYWVFNAMASYPISERTSLQVNLNNLTNRYYYDQIHPAHIVPGAGFTALAGINFRF
jgi:catecholate siderophore receptor